MRPELFEELRLEKSRSYPEHHKGIFRTFLPYLYPGATNKFSRAALAQLVERLIRNQQIVSSNLTGGSIISRVYVQKQHINPCFVLGLQRKIWRKIHKISFSFSVLQKFLIYSIYTLAFEGSFSGNSEQKTFPLSPGIFPFFSSPLRHAIYRISCVHAGLRAEFFYPIYTLSNFALFVRPTGMRGAR